MGKKTLNFVLVIESYAEIKIQTYFSWFKLDVNLENWFNSVQNDGGTEKN